MKETESNSQKVIRGMSSQTLVTILLGIVEILVFSIMSRLLSKEDFGYYAIISAIVTVFASFSETGIGSAIIQQKTIDKQFVNNAFTLSLLFGLVVSLALLFSSGSISVSFSDNKLKLPLALMSLTILLNCLTSVHISLMYRRLEFLKVGIINLISLIVTSTVAIYLANLGLGFYAILIKTVLASIITYLLTLLYCKASFRFAFDFTTYKKIFRFSGWLMASGLFRNLSEQIDRLLMPKLLSVSALGAYNRPKELLTQISIKLNGIFDTALFPVLSSIQDDKNKMLESFKKSLYLMNLFGMFIALTVAVNSPLFVRVFLGEQWMELSTLNMVLSFSLLFNADGRLADCYLRSMAKTKQQFCFRVFETIITVIGLLIGYRYNILGVAIAFITTTAFITLIKMCYVSYNLEMRKKELFLTILSSWKFVIFIVPFILILKLLLPSTIMGYVILAILYGIWAFVLFLLLPNLVGFRYKQIVYDRLRESIYSKLSTIKK